MSLGLPILSPLKGFAYELINEYDIGWNYPPKESSTLARIIMDIIESPNKIKLMSENAMTLFKTNYNFDVVYDQLVNKLEQITNNK